MKKMFVFDYDGTYYRNNEELQNNIKLMNSARKKGHLLVIATGRSYVSFMKEVEKFNIDYDYLILSSGALIIDKNEHIIGSYAMDLNLVKGVNKLLEPYHASLQSQMYIDEFMNSEILSQLNQVIKMTYTFNKGDICYEIQQSVNTYTHDEFKTYVVAGTSYDYVEIISSKTNKAVAILDLLKHIQEDYTIVAAGDSENDVEMLIEFDGYLMNNHDPRLDTYRLRIVDSIESIVKKEI